MTQMNNHNRKWMVLAGVSIASFLGCIDFTIVNTVLPAIQADMQVTVAELQWVINIFVLALSTFMVAAGRMADLYGRKRVLYIGMLFFGLASLGAGLSSTFSWLIVFRLVQGISCAILYTATGAIVSNAFPPNERGKAIGALFGVNGIGLAIGPVLGGIIASTIGWQWVFLINVPLILLAWCICLFSVQESRQDGGDHAMDWPGLLILMLALPALILAITQVGNAGMLAGFSALMFVLFYYVERRSKAPIIEFELFLNKPFFASLVATFALAFFYCLAFFLMPLFLQIIKGHTGFGIGMMLLPTTAAVALLSPLVGRLSDRHGPRPLLIAGFLLFIVSAAMQAAFKPDSSVYYVLSAFLCMGAGWACILGPATMVATLSVPDSHTGLAMGTSWTLHNIGGAVGLALGLVAYQRFALQQLRALLPDAHLNLQAMVANPEQAEQMLGLSMDKIRLLIEQFFLSGYQAAMYLLVVSSALALLAVCALLNRKIKPS